ncbi:FAD-dependent oxidoreductase [Amycolatopsis sp. A133]|uniref:NAD(P)/FAD-dependent oxidoreductase n=1 Tax=Amycolatopsis sp. A133 TaxID=3064472 RepID=UPI0027FEB19F|nr:FAD-dependent oxidoreductase [Amycolatopsis sp. A133]MDQ7807522.1 FAD-dependent oxidoreductase [Amycolatopsis sp. A133]
MNSAVVVVGGGYAGTLVAKSLDGDAEVTLIDPRDAFVNYAGSLRALTRPDWAHRPFFAYRTLLDNGHVLRDTVTSADSTGVTLASGGRVDAGHLVLATGSSHSYPAHPRHAATSAAQAVADLRHTNDQLARAERVLILGAGPVGLELSGEIREVWPDKRITIVDPAPELLPGFLPEVRDDLRRQLEELKVELRLGTSLTALPPVEAGTETAFTVLTDTGEPISADIWFRSFGARVNTGYLEDGALVELTERHTVPVDAHLNVVGHRNVYALGDIADLPDAKMATHAQTQAPVVVENIRARLRGEQPGSVYEPASVPRIFLPLGTKAGVGQLPGPEGAAVAAPLETVVRRKGADLFTAQFAQRFKPATEAR